MTRKISILLSCFFALLFVENIIAQVPPSGLIPFVFKVKTDNAGDSSNNQFTIPINSNQTYDYDVDWEYDGDVPNYEDVNVSGNITHIYDSPGTYTIAIIGVFPQIFFNNSGDRLKIIEVVQWGTNQWTSMEGAFYGCENLDVTAIDAPNLDDVTSMRAMFRGCTNLIGTESFNTWDVSQITTMRDMFAYARNFNQPLNHWNVSEVTSMSSMFNGATIFNQDLTWNVSKVTDMSGMFFSARDFNGDITEWNTSSLDFMFSMFWGATNFNQDIGNWDVSSARYMSYTFRLASSFDQNLGNWDITNVRNIGSMFSGAGLSTTNYDLTLIGWATDNSGLEADGEDDIPTALTFHGGNSQYCESETKRQELIDIYEWEIEDGNLHPNCGNIELSLKVYLQGAITNPHIGEEHLMRDDLRVAGVLPITSPYTDNATIDPIVLNTSGSDAIVDWVWIELRDATDQNLVINAQSALLQRDGDVVSTDGTSELVFLNTPDDYSIVVQHRNHLGILTNSVMSLALDTYVDFTSSNSLVTGGELALINMNNGIFAMYAGDANTDGNILNTDINNAISVSGNINSYLGADANMDGNVLNTDIVLFIQPNAGRIQQF
ncbi:hypothetical protein GCM10011344_00270 [Dokdonia pacifica]|uniref:Surface protein n=1 Tax=Dokdonia pacifica TaxID=1627892 RepID=A0A239D2S6_9FLAO|nr:BspA family leucine-rich repeat surface protein [Dokdonia pacifica]GGG03874.1 hypothetical protein GCM10011344_00270 [Dokdonia pacifica]SNS26607.1 surface protein [Dokdonia pacifica]